MSQKNRTPSPQPYPHDDDDSLVVSGYTEGEDSGPSSTAPWSPMSKTGSQGRRPRRGAKPQGNKQRGGGFGGPGVGGSGQGTPGVGGPGVSGPGVGGPQGGPGVRGPGVGGPQGGPGVRGPGVGAPQPQGGSGVRGSQPQGGPGRSPQQRGTQGRAAGPGASSPQPQGRSQRRVAAGPSRRGPQDNAGRGASHSTGPLETTGRIKAASARRNMRAKSQLSATSASRKPLEQTSDHQLLRNIFMLLQAIIFAGIVWFGLNYYGIYQSVITTKINVLKMVGDDPINTAVDIASRNFSDSETILLLGTNSLNDGIMATGLAGALHAPIFYTDSDAVSPRTLDALRGINPQNVILLGGTAVISQGVEDELAKLLEEATITRIAGPTRGHTMVQFNEELKKAAQETLARGKRFAVATERDDLWSVALTGGLAADWANPMPVVLSHSSGASEFTDKVLKDLDIRKVFGKNTTVNFSPSESFPDEISLAKAIITERGYPATFVVLVPEGDVMRAVLGAPLAGKNSGVTLPLSDVRTQQWIKDNCGTVKNIVLVGTGSQEENAELDKVLSAAKACKAEINYLGGDSESIPDPAGSSTGNKAPTPIAIPGAGTPGQPGQPAPTPIELPGEQ